MPRLTDTDYLEAHHYLQEAWRLHDGIAFGLLLWHEQRALHDYFLPSKKLSDAALLAHRRRVTIKRPSLPQRAGKALARCQTNIAEFNERPPVPYVRQLGVRRQRPKGEHYIVVHGVACADFEPQRLVKLAQRIKRDQDLRAS